MLGLYCCLLLASAPQDQNADTGQSSQADTELIEVSGRAFKAIGNTLTGSSGTVAYEDLQDRPIARVGEILEVVPGLIATQHSGTGKANQLFLRGFNLDHGTDFATKVDGVPLNMRSHGHGQGYTDLNIVIPELVERVDFKKGPYHLDAGDFSSAGSADISTYNRLDENFGRFTFGEFGYGRAVLANSFDLSQNTHLLTALEAQTYDGPFEIAENLEKLNGLVKLSGKQAGIDWLLSLSGYHANWRATDQIPERLIDDGTLDAFGSLDPDLGGNTTRYSASAQLTTQNASVEAYFVDYDFQLFSNFTYFLNNSPFLKNRRARVDQNQVVEHPHHTTGAGDEIEQVDRRQLFGAEATYVFTLGGPLAANLEVGANFRHDDIAEVGLHGTQARVRHTLIRNDTVSSTGFGGYGKISGEIGRLRFEGGLRLDSLQVDVAATLPQNSGGAKDTLFSPSASLAYRISEKIEIYANYGEAFHSNDARGATINIDPLSRNLVDSVPLLVKSRGAEIGLRLEAGPVGAALVGFWLDLDSELVYVGDEGTVEALGASRRYGLESSLYWRATRWATLFANYSYTKARFRGVEEDTHIPNAVPSVLSAGLEVEPIEDLKSSLILRRVGAAPLIEDNSVRSNTTLTLNWGSYLRVEHFRFGVEVLNLLNSKDADISYYFESQLQRELFPVADVHTHQMEPRQLRVSLEVTF